MGYPGSKRASSDGKIRRCPGLGILVQSQYSCFLVKVQVQSPATVVMGDYCPSRQVDYAYFSRSRAAASTSFFSLE